ncbi:hypothetical protein [Epibacterium sp. Ofav1-8]|nr:hypothetical protein [Epibacterium sp. Ofav1-8]
MRKLFGLSLLVVLLPAAAAVTGERDTVMYLEAPARITVVPL